MSDQTCQPAENAANSSFTIRQDVWELVKEINKIQDDRYDFFDRVHRWVIDDYRIHRARASRWRDKVDALILHLQRIGETELAEWVVEKLMTKSNVYNPANFELLISTGVGSETIRIIGDENRGLDAGNTISKGQDTAWAEVQDGSTRPHHAYGQNSNARKEPPTLEDSSRKSLQDEQAEARPILPSSFDTGLEYQKNENQQSANSSRFVLYDRTAHVERKRPGVDFKYFDKLHSQREETQGRFRWSLRPENTAWTEAFHLEQESTYPIPATSGVPTASWKNVESTNHMAVSSMVTRSASKKSNTAQR